MIPPPFAFARRTNVRSTYSKMCSAIAGMLLRSGRISAPPGRMWSVETPAPSLIRTSPSIESETPPSGMGTGPMFGPLYTWTFDRSRGGGTYIESSTGYDASSLTVGGRLPRSRGSAICPWRAVAAAVSGLQRYTRSSGVPLLPGKFRLNVRIDAPFVGGANPIPMHGPQATSSSRTPDLISFVITPESRQAMRTDREPGDTAIERPGWICFPLRISATIARSRNEEFTLLPTATWVTSVPATSETGLTFPGVDGHAISGSIL